MANDERGDVLDLTREQLAERLGLPIQQQKINKEEEEEKKIIQYHRNNPLRNKLLKEFVYIANLDQDLMPKASLQKALKAPKNSSLSELENVLKAREPKFTPSTVAEITKSKSKSRSRSRSKSKSPDR